MTSRDNLSYRHSLLREDGGPTPRRVLTHFYFVRNLEPLMTWIPSSSVEPVLLRWPLGLLCPIKYLSCQYTGVVPIFETVERFFQIIGATIGRQAATTEVHGSTAPQLTVSTTETETLISTELAVFVD